MSAELAHAEQVMLAHDKPHDKPHGLLKHHHKEIKDKTEDGPQTYNSLYSSFDELKTKVELPAGSHQVFYVSNKTRCLWLNTLLLGLDGGMR